MAEQVATETKAAEEVRKATKKKKTAAREAATEAAQWLCLQILDGIT